MQVEIIILADVLPTSKGEFYKGAKLTVTDSKKILQASKDGKIEYVNKNQMSLNL